MEHCIGVTLVQPKGDKHEVAPVDIHIPSLENETLEKSKRINRLRGIEISKLRYL